MAALCIKNTVMSVHNTVMWRLHNRNQCMSHHEMITCMLVPTKSTTLHNESNSIHHTVMSVYNITITVHNSSTSVNN